MTTTDRNIVSPTKAVGIVKSGDPDIFSSGCNASERIASFDFGQKILYTTGNQPFQEREVSLNHDFVGHSSAQAKM